jgi:hypothetical protein
VPGNPTIEPGFLELMRRRRSKQRFFAKNAYESEPGALAPSQPMPQINRSFLVLFFKKELLLKST